MIGMGKSLYHKWVNEGFDVHGVQRRMISVVNVFVVLRLLLFCFVVAIYDLVHAVEAMFGLPGVLRAFGNLF